MKEDELQTSSLSEVIIAVSARLPLRLEEVGRSAFEVLSVTS